MAAKEKVNCRFPSLIAAVLLLAGCATEPPAGFSMFCTSLPLASNPFESPNRSEFEPQDEIAIVAFGPAIKGKSLRIELHRAGVPPNRSPLRIGAEWPNPTVFTIRRLPEGEYTAWLVIDDVHGESLKFTVRRAR